MKTALALSRQPFLGKMLPGTSHLDAVSMLVITFAEVMIKKPEESTSKSAESSDISDGE